MVLVPDKEKQALKAAAEKAEAKAASEPVVETSEPVAQPAPVAPAPDDVPEAPAATTVIVPEEPATSDAG